ncbi:helix-turn-helix domain-containing protein [Sphingomonas sp. LB2R24]|uniref:helix-turn-helix domain-containing protein n=1 Tax=Sphingomonas sorbitolis TaxID=3096165 RepID=UPI002FCA26F0
MEAESQNLSESWMRPGTLDWAQRAAIVDALEHCHYCCAKAAKRLECSRSTLYRHVEAFKIPTLNVKRGKRPVKHLHTLGEPPKREVIVLQNGQYLLMKV